MPDIEAYTVPDFLRAFGIGRTKLYEEINAGRLKAKRAGGRTLILASDAKAWADALPAFRPAKAA